MGAGFDSSIGGDVPDWDNTESRESDEDAAWRELVARFTEPVATTGPAPWPERENVPGPQLPRGAGGPGGTPGGRHEAGRLPGLDGPRGTDVPRADGPRVEGPRADELASPVPTSPVPTSPVLASPVPTDLVTRKGCTVRADLARPEAIAAQTDGGARTGAAAPKASVPPTARAVRAAREARPARPGWAARAGQAPAKARRGPGEPREPRGIKTAGRRAAPRGYAGSMTRAPGGPSARTGGRGRTNRT